MRSRKSEEILRRIKSLMPATPAPVRVERPRDLGNLQKDLRNVLDLVGKENYAHATARLFAMDGPYSGTRVKRRYAID